MLDSRYSDPLTLWSWSQSSPTETTNPSVNSQRSCYLESKYTGWNPVSNAIDSPGLFAQNSEENINDNIQVIQLAETQKNLNTITSGMFTTTLSSSTDPFRAPLSLKEVEDMVHFLVQVDPEIPDEFFYNETLTRRASQTDTLLAANFAKNPENYRKGSDENDCSHYNFTRRKRTADSSQDARREDAYWEKRRKNNTSAKKSRDIKRYRQKLMEAKVAKLEAENEKLKKELDALKQENTEIKNAKHFKERKMFSREDGP